MRRVAQATLQKGRMCSTLANEVLVEEIGEMKRVTLNRPKALNSLNLNMVRILQKNYDAWQQQGKGFIVMAGAGEKAFCAGGDVVAVMKEDADGPLRRDFFLEEYKLNYTIKTYPLPHIAILNGIVMGGGVGLSVHGSHRIVTEKTLFAMPETAIGLFPDVGGSIFLPRMPHRGLGMYLALTGERLKGADCLHAVVGTNFVKSENVEALEKDLMTATQAKVDSVIAAHEVPAADLPAFSLQPHLDRIAKTFTLGSLDDIIQELDRENDDWSKKTLKQLRKASPTSLKITHEQITRGAHQTPHENLAMEARMVYGCMNHSGDFNEGIRALLIDRDNSPKWSPATLDEVTPELVKKFFEPRPDREFSAEKAAHL